jgi:hypothetical protein
MIMAKVKRKGRAGVWKE